MKFLYPEFLWALLVLIIPILIHLFNLRRYKKVSFTNVRFLKELQKETRSTRTLRQLLVLLARLLALAFLVLAFAQPYIPVAGEEESVAENVIMVYVDNSFSMEAESERGPALEVARVRADEIIKAYKETDRYVLVTNDFNASARLMNQDEALGAIDEIEIHPDSRSIEEVLNRMESVLVSSGQQHGKMFLLSDFQYLSKEGEIIELQDTMSDVFLLPVRAKALRNIAVDSVYFDDPMVRLNEPAHLNVRVRNHGVDDREGLSLSLRMDGELRATTTIDVPAGAFATTGIDLVIKNGGWRSAKVEIIDEPVVFDDVMYFSFPVKPFVRILDVYHNEPNKSITGIFQDDSYYRLERAEIKSLDYSKMGEYDLIILDDANSVSSGLAKVLDEYVTSGGALCVIPGKEVEDLSQLSEVLNISTYGALQVKEGEVANIAYENELFDNVFEKVTSNISLPEVKKYYPISLRPSSERLMSLRNGDPFLVGEKRGNGKVYLFSTPLSDDFSNLRKHAILVPTMLKMSLQSSVRYPLSYVVGGMELIRVRDQISAEESGLKLSKGDFSVVPEFLPNRNGTFISDNGQIQEAGNYVLSNSDSNLQVISFNYDRAESNSVMPDDETLIGSISGPSVRLLDAVENNIGQRLKEVESGRRFWVHCLLLSLFFILIEILLLRLWPMRIKSTE